MQKKDFTKKLSAFLAASMLVSITPVTFAEPNDIIINEDNQTPETPTSTPINVRVVYADGETEGTYKLSFVSTTTLTSIKNISFTVTTKAEGSTIENYTFGDLATATDSDARISSNMSKTTLTFEKGAFSTPVSGTPVLCTIEVKSTTEPSVENIELTGFTAYGTNESAITFTSTLDVIKQPTMTSAATKVYNDLCALPTSDSLSFYESDGTTLADIDDISKEISDVKTAYGNLTADEVKSVTDTFDFNGLTAPNIETLEKIVADMLKVSDTMILLTNLNKIESKDLLGNRFLTSTYNSKIALSDTDEEKLNFAADSTLKTQYEAAKTSISTISASVERAYTDLGVTSDGFSKKIELLDAQLENIQKLSTDKYYADYLADLTTQADNILTELEDYDNATYKDTLINRVNNCKAKIKVVQDSISAMPTVTFPTQIKKGSRYNVTVNRSKSNSVKAQIRVDVYNTGETDSVLDSNTFDFATGKTSIDCDILASSKKYPGDKYVDVYVYYIIEGAEFLADTQTIYSKIVSSLNNGNTGIPSSSGSGSSSGTSGGTIFPNSSDKNDKDDNKNDDTETEELFSDIENYGWAREAIEGLYYVGIVNGMEDGIFNPAGDVTREQFCKMVVQLFGVLNNNETATDFADVDPNAWYAPYISSSIRAGYVQGQSDEYFGIGESIMRQDMATILYRALGEQNARAVLDFTDVSDIATYAEDAISELVGLSVLSGYEDGSFKPRGTATRAEAAKVIWGIYNIIND